MVGVPPVGQAGVKAVIFNLDRTIINSRIAVDVLSGAGHCRRPSRNAIRCRRFLTCWDHEDSTFEGLDLKFQPWGLAEAIESLRTN